MPIGKSNLSLAIIYFNLIFISKNTSKNSNMKTNGLASQMIQTVRKRAIAKRIIKKNLVPN